MSETQLIKRWNEEQPQYRAWGSFVVSEMQRLIGEQLQDNAVESFLRIPPKARLKETPSLVDKAFNRGKSYTDPYEQITDKVGVRFVVLLNEDVRQVEHLLLDHRAWTARKDKDYEQERSDKPLLFTYQSLHYIVFANEDIKVSENLVRAGTPCEVQIRTLLQHAHSELTHSRLYKPSVTATPEMMRASAKSMALIEAADDYFDKISARTREIDFPVDEAKEVLASFFTGTAGLEPKYQKSSSLILDALKNALGADLEDRLARILKSDPYIVDIIKERGAENSLYRQPVVLLLYELAKTRPAYLKEYWPLNHADIRPIYADLGVSFDRCG